MEKNQYKSAIKLIQVRYSYLELTFEQAQKVHSFENDHSCPPYFSMWEEWDFEFDSFKEILSEKQFNKYQKNLKEVIELNEKQLAQQDKNFIQQIKYNTEILKHLKKTVLPTLFRNTGFPLDMWLTGLTKHQSKIDFLKASYNEYLIQSRKEIVVNHYRYNRRFKPNELKNSLLQYEISCVWPNYFQFKLQMDEPTKASKDYLFKNLKNYFKPVDDHIKKKFKESKKYTDKLNKKYFGEPQGWHTKIKHIPDEELENNLMTFLLLNNKY